MATEMGGTNKAAFTQKLECDLYGTCQVDYFANEEKENVFGIGLSLWTNDRGYLLDSVYLEAVIDKQEKADSILRLLAQNLVTPVSAVAVVDELFSPYHTYHHLVAHM